ncbi:hypothetical protein CC79DRAFT_1330132 [Sarocladium strictum]
MSPDDTRPSPQRRPPPLPPLIGKDQNPGAAADGTVLQSIETAVEKHVKAKPSIDLEYIHDLVKDFPVVRAEKRDVCPFYLDRCIRYFQRVADDASSSGRSVAASRENAEGRSAVASRKTSQTTPPTSTERERPSTLALDDFTDNIEILLPNEGSKAVTYAFRNRDTSYISPDILKRCSLSADGKDSQVSIDLRWRIVDERRGRSYRVPNCLFRVRDDLKTDLAIGLRVRKQLDTWTGPTEDSYDPKESTDNEAFGNGHWRSISRHAKTSSHAGSSTRSSGGPSNAKAFLETMNRVIDLDISERNEDLSAHSNRRSDRDDLHTMSPERPSRSRRR